MKIHKHNVAHRKNYLLSVVLSKSSSLFFLYVRGGLEIKVTVKSTMIGTISFSIDAKSLGHLKPKCLMRSLQKT